jgi:hypothetical protein
VSFNRAIANPLFHSCGLVSIRGKAYQADDFQIIKFSNFQIAALPGFPILVWPPSSVFIRFYPWLSKMLPAFRFVVIREIRVSSHFE